MLYKSELDHNTMKVTKNNCAKGEGTVDHCTVTRWFKKICLGYKNLNNQQRLGRLKSMDSEAVLQTIKVN